MDGQANILDVIIDKYDQETFHTRVLTWLLDPSGSHGAGQALLNELLKLVPQPFTLGEIHHVKNEFSLDPQNTPDIGVLGDEGILLIENKIRYPAITPGQIDRYVAGASQIVNGRDFRLIFLLPGMRKELPHVTGTLSSHVTVIFWSELSCIVSELAREDVFPECSQTSVLMWLDRICRTFAHTADVSAMSIGNPRLSSLRSAPSTDHFSKKQAYLSESSDRCRDDPDRLDRILALVGYLELFPLLRIEFKKGPTHWNVTGSIPRNDGGVTLIIGMYAKGRVWTEFRRLPEDLANKYRRLVGFPNAGGWKEFNVDQIPLEQLLFAIRTITSDACQGRLDVIR